MAPTIQMYLCYWEIMLIATAWITNTKPTFLISIRITLLKITYCGPHPAIMIMQIILRDRPIIMYLIMMYFLCLQTARQAVCLQALKHTILIITVTYILFH